MSLRKLRRNSTIIGKDPKVLIIKPYNRNLLTNEKTNDVIMASVVRGVASYLPIASITPDVARNKGIEDFLNNPEHKKKTHIYFMDDDSPPNSPFIVEKLLRHNKPVVSGITPMIIERTIPDYVLYPDGKIRKGIIDEGIHNKIDCWFNAIIKNTDGIEEAIGVNDLPTSPFKVERVGGSCLLVRRDVLEKLEPPYMKFTYDERNITLKKGEDIDFCEKIRKAGFDIWVDPDCICGHYHQFNILEIFNMLRQANKLGLDGKKI